MVDVSLCGLVPDVFEGFHPQTTGIVEILDWLKMGGRLDGSLDYREFMWALIKYSQLNGNIYRVKKHHRAKKYVLYEERDQGLFTLFLQKNNGTDLHSRVVNELFKHQIEPVISGFTYGEKGDGVHFMNLDYIKVEPFMFEGERIDYFTPYNGFSTYTFQPHFNLKSLEAGKISQKSINQLKRCLPERQDIIDLAYGEAKRCRWKKECGGLGDEKKGG